MSDLCTSAVSPNSCSHFVVGGADESGPWSLQVAVGDLQVPLTPEENAELRRLLLKKIRQKGITIQQFIGRVVRGEEATNMKVYQLIGNGASITKTNIGTSYVNISPRANGERTLIDFTGCAEYRIVARANLAGNGPFGLRVVR